MNDSSDILEGDLADKALSFSADQAHVRPTYIIVRFLFLRLLGLIFLIAFVSFWVQVDGLVGKNGILPAAEFLKMIEDQLDVVRYFQFPTLCWFSASETFIYCLCGVGVACSILLIAGVLPKPSLIVLWITYLSLVVIGQTFMSFQWDSLLLEVAFLSIFFAPMSFWPRLSKESASSLVFLWLLRWLLFRLMFLSGITKLASGDPIWADLTALDFHYETQPLPTWIGYYAHQLPGWFQKFSMGAMFVIEIIVPFLIFMTRKIRFVACGLLLLLQLLIATTGNYCFFNLLAMALCLTLLDDSFLLNFAPRKHRGRFAGIRSKKKSSRTRLAVASVVALPIVVVSFITMAAEIWGYRQLPKPAMQVVRWTSPFRSVNGYGLFRVMTTTRFEIVVQGSDNGREWKAYEFRYKPGAMDQRPGFVAPHQPRLDWQMWFAALGTHQQNPWFVRFLGRILEGAPEVLTLLEINPFPDKPPRYIRAVRYRYHMTDLDTRNETQVWWRREPAGLYTPPVSLK